uniref:F-box associated beta-propeller type 1 domain-containing protein n=1 Tax=Fagus sylvatica TaxID=28930 RepID=A0A2N9HHM1_FAGSY
MMNDDDDEEEELEEEEEEEETAELKEKLERQLEGEEEEIDCSSIPFLWDAIKFKVWGHCDGLLCGEVERLKGSALIVWNPSLREYIELSSSPPPTSPKNKDMIHGIGYDTHSEDYKVVKISQCVSYGERPKFKPEVYILSIMTKSWKRIPNNLSFSISSYEEIHVNGSVYWICMFPASTILCFDLVEENISLVDLPEKPDWWTECKLMNTQGSLCLGLYGAKRLSISVFSLSPNDKDGTRVWIKLFRLCTCCFHKTITPPGLTWSLEFLLKWSWRRVRVSWCCERRYLSANAFHYKESLVSPYRLVCNPSSS